MSRSPHPRSKLMGMLSGTLGEEKASAIVDEAAQVLGYGPALDRDQALSVLEHIAQSPGLVGIAARFAKSRVHLVWSEAANERTR